jgi:hypothetical protein
MVRGPVLRVKEINVLCWESQALVFPPTAEATQTLLFAWTNLRSEV